MYIFLQNGSREYSKSNRENIGEREREREGDREREKMKEGGKGGGRTMVFYSQNRK